MKNNLKNSVIIAIVLAMGIGIGYFFSGSSQTPSHQKNEVSQEHNHKEDATIWTCSMHPQIKRNEPGKCPICGMDLIPMETNNSDELESDPNEIQMSESALKLAEIETFIVKKGTLDKSIHLQGKIQPDERNIAVLTARFGGRIEKLYVNYTGQTIKKGQKLASIYSPELNIAQRELLDALKTKASNPSLYFAARNKLKLLELTEEQIDAIEQSKEPSIYFDVISPISGTVTQRNVAIGDYVKEGSPLFEIIDLNHIWVMFDAYESQLPWIKLGDKITFSTQSLPGKSFSAKITFISPFINPNTRVASVRAEMDNYNHIFKPEMFVNGLLKTSIKNDQIIIPKTAVLWTGKRSIVYVKVPNRNKTSFLYREIELGNELGGFYTVVSGLEEDEEIASNGVFKIDASAQIQGKQSMMTPTTTH